jgi:hypothetical protein
VPLVEAVDEQVGASEGPAVDEDNPHRRRRRQLPERVGDRPDPDAAVAVPWLEAGFDQVGLEALE